MYVCVYLCVCRFVCMCRAEFHLRSHPQELCALFAETGTITCLKLVGFPRQE